MNRRYLRKDGTSKRISFFFSNSVHWPQGIHLKKAMWHSCMQWGWDKIRSGDRLARWSEYWVLTVCWRSHGVCWHYYPKGLR